MNIDIEAWKDVLLEKELKAIEHAKFVRSLIIERDALEKERNDLKNKLNEMQEK